MLRGGICITVKVKYYYLRHHCICSCMCNSLLFLMALQSGINIASTKQCCCRHHVRHIFLGYLHCSVVCTKNCILATCSHALAKIFTDKSVVCAASKAFTSRTHTSVFSACCCCQSILHRLLCLLLVVVTASRAPLPTPCFFPQSSFESAPEPIAVFCSLWCLHHLHRHRLL